MNVCARSWGSYDAGWTFCTEARGHQGPCRSVIRGEKPPSALYYEEQPEAAAAFEKSVVEDRKREAKKAHNQA